MRAGGNAPATESLALRAGASAVTGRGAADVGFDGFGASTRLGKGALV